MSKIEDLLLLWIGVRDCWVHDTKKRSSTREIKAHLMSLH
jgi:hypothetical protein